MKKDKIKCRRTWDINPETRIKDNAKKYNRIQNKQELYKNIKDIEDLEKEDYETM